MQAPRCQFVRAFIFLAGAAFVTGCGSGPNNPISPPIPGPPAGPGGVTGTISGNHAAPHVAIISAAQLSHGAGITLDISNGFHSHDVIITDAQMGQIAAQIRLSVASSVNPHSNGSDPHGHTVTFN